MQATRAKFHILRDARLCPPTDGRGEEGQAAGVFTPDGSFFAACNVERDGAFELTPRRISATPGRVLPGRFLYAGQLNHHFGHFLCESLSRLWPFDDPSFDVDGILLLPRRQGALGALRPFQAEVFGLLGPLPPIHLIDEPMIVEELVVPEQGFGTARLCGGLPEFRAFIRSRFAKAIAAEGPERLYISRTRLSAKRGAVVGEEAVARALEREGYEIFWPERNPVAVQVARYRAARHLVAIEGSALHLFGFVGGAGQRVAQIVRRSDGAAAEGIARQLRAFCDLPVTMVQSIRREWNVAGRDRLASKSVPEIDVPEVGRQLAQAGFVADGVWPTPPDDEAQTVIAHVSKRTGLRYEPF